MRILMASIQINEGHSEEYIEAILEDARGSVRDEPGCVRFDVIQDGGDPNKIWVYEVFKDEAAVEAHRQAPHLLKFRETVKDWQAGEPRGASRGSYNIWPPDEDWK